MSGPELQAQFDEYGIKRSDIIKELLPVRTTGNRKDLVKHACYANNYKKEMISANKHRSDVLQTDVINFFKR